MWEIVGDFLGEHMEMGGEGFKSVSAWDMGNCVQNGSQFDITAESKSMPSTFLMCNDFHFTQNIMWKLTKEVNNLIMGFMTSPCHDIHCIFLLFLYSYYTLNIIPNTILFADICDVVICQ